MIVTWIKQHLMTIPKIIMKTSMHFILATLVYLSFDTCTLMLIIHVHVLEFTHFSFM